MTMTACAVSTAGELRNDIDVNRRHTIATDVPEGLGGSDTAPAPHELLPAMIASCVSTMIGLYARARDWELEDVCVDVTYDSDATPRHAHVTVHLPAGLTPDQVSASHELWIPAPSSGRSRPGSRWTGSSCFRAELPQWLRQKWPRNGDRPASATAVSIRRPAVRL
jgi:putative redox protein